MTGRPARIVAAGTAVVAALALAPAALAHARLLDSTPANLAVLPAAPLTVTLRFDDAVVAVPGAAAIRNGGGGSVLAGPERTKGSVVTVPLKPGLRDGDYTVRWRVLGDDGHLIEGVLAFGVGAGRAPPVPELGLLGSGPRWGFVLARWLTLVGLLLALGGLAFRALALRGGRHPLDGRLLVGVAAAFAVALAGGGLSIVAVPDALHTRFGEAAIAAIVAAAAGAALTEVSRSTNRFPLLALPAAVALAVAVTVGGHALDLPAGLRPLKVAVDLVHLGAAGVWVGGVAAVGLLAPRLAAEERTLVQRRFGVVAGASVALVAATGVGRAAFGLSSVAQAWDTGYGRALVVKSVLLVVALGAAVATRRKLGGRVPVAAELAVLAGIVVAVAILSDLRPGRDGSIPRALPALQALPPAPDPAAVTLAREEGDLAFAVAVRTVPGGRLELTASILGQDRFGVDGRDVSLGADGPPQRALPCGAGCYTVTVAAPARLRQVTASLDGRALGPFVFPAWPPKPAAALVRKAAATFTALRTLVFTERLASSPRSAETSTQRVIAPDRFAYESTAGGSGVVIGETRWDRFPGDQRWTKSQTQRLALPAITWGDTPTNAFEIGTGVLDGHAVRIVTLVDPHLPGWFTAWIDTTSLLPLRVDMTTAAHFMVDRYGPFNGPVTVVPPKGTGAGSPAVATSSTP